MSQENTNVNDENASGGLTEDDFETKVTARVEEKLKVIKENLDKAYAARDEAVKRIAEREKQDRELELKRLEEEGKLKEAAEIRLAEERAARETAERRIVELTRDNTLRSVLSQHDFRNQKAANLAFQELTSQLQQDASGNWIHSSGIPIEEAVNNFVQDESNHFLLKPKVSSGGGAASVGTPALPTTGSLFNLSQTEVMKLAREGKLRKRT